MQRVPPMANHSWSMADTSTVYKCLLPLLWLLQVICSYDIVFLQEIRNLNALFQFQNHLNAYTAQPVGFVLSMRTQTFSCTALYIFIPYNQFIQTLKSCTIIIIYIYIYIYIYFSIFPCAHIRHWWCYRAHMHQRTVTDDPSFKWVDSINRCKTIYSTADHAHAWGFGVYVWQYWL